MLASVFLPKELPGPPAYTAHFHHMPNFSGNLARFLSRFLARFLARKYSAEFYWVRKCSVEFHHDREMQYYSIIGYLLSSF